MNLITFDQMTGSYPTPQAAVYNAHAVYTDVWTSMGFEHQRSEAHFAGFQVNESLMAHTKPEAIFMHCMPMERDKEVSSTLPDEPTSVIFTQSENRFHVQKALLIFYKGNWDLWRKTHQCSLGELRSSGFSIF